MEEGIINKVQESGIITINLDDYYQSGERVQYDLRQNLVEDVLLREKDFRAFIKENDWSSYQDKLVAIHCSVDAVIPQWAYMLLASALQPYAKVVVAGNIEQLEHFLIQQSLQSINPEDYKDKRVVIKGCGKYDLPLSALTVLVTLLQPVAKSIMYGEPCSTVPVYKRQVL
ncbi:MAG: DUF2480 family protein [Bacteroidetes bacterium]|nr:DUF2480 family protein [Bacteroidota bacterium]